jgi:hypothetical protein
MAYTPKTATLLSQHHSSRNGQPITLIVVHATAGKDSRSWLVSNPSQVSIHVLIQKDGTIIRMVPDDQAAHHAGFSKIVLDGVTYSQNSPHGCNEIALGIELENLNDGHDVYPDAQLQACAWQIETWLAAYSTLKAIVMHRDIDQQGKTDAAGLTLAHLQPYRDQVRHAALVSLTMLRGSPVYEAPQDGSRVSLNGTGYLQAGTTFQGSVIASGWAWHSSGIGFLPPSTFSAIVRPPTPARETYTEHSPLTGTTAITAERASAWVVRQGSTYTAGDISLIIGSIWRWAALVGINPVIVLAQCVVETSEGGKPFSSWWAQRPRRNGCGFGVTGTSQVALPSPMDVSYLGVTYPRWAARDVWYEGVSFPSWDVAIRAQVGRLLLYTQAISGSPDQQNLATFAHALRPLSAGAQHTVTELQHLGAAKNPANQGKPHAQWIAGWAWDGIDYGAKIAAVATRIVVEA